MIAYHINTDPPWQNTDGNSRKNIYSVPGTPVVWIDGVKSTVGADTVKYRSDFNSRKTIAPEAEITLTGTYNKTSGQGSATASIKNISGAALAGTCQFVLCQKDTAFTWGPTGNKNNALHYIERKMLPNYNGTAVNIAVNETKNVTQSFTVETTWRREGCYLVVFVQKSNKEIAQAIETDLLQLTGTPINNQGNNPAMTRVDHSPFSIIHNPDNASILIKTDLKETAITIFDSKGCVRKSAKISAQNNRVSIADLSSGVYFCVLGNDYTIKTKFIKY